MSVGHRRSSVIWFGIALSGLIFGSGQMSQMLDSVTGILAAPGDSSGALFAAESIPLDLPEKDDGLPGAGPIRRYDWFRSLWKDRRAAWAKRVEQDQKAVVFLGDSITQGWGDEFGKSFDQLKLANRGISGDTTRGMLIRLQDDVLRLNPTAVVLLMGTNDLEEGASPEMIAGNVKLILEALQKHRPEMPVVVCQVFPSSDSKKRPAAKIKAINELYQTHAKQFPQVTVVDTWTLFANPQGDARAEEFPDLLHPNEKGYRMWGQALRPIFATLGLLETEPDPFVLEDGFKSLSNGKDLTGWGFRETPKSNTVTAFDGKVTSPDGRYAVINQLIVVTTPREGRRIQQLWTTKEFPEDFILKLEFRATPNADSGVFIRQPQLQCRDYLLAGPYLKLQKYRPQEWNELVVTVRGNVAHCTCNGEVLEEKLALPPTGPIGLEGDRGQMEYRRLRWKPLTAEAGK